MERGCKKHEVGQIHLSSERSSGLDLLYLRKFSLAASNAEVGGSARKLIHLSYCLPVSAHPVPSPSIPRSFLPPESSQVIPTLRRPNPPDLSVGSCYSFLMTWPAISAHVSCRSGAGPQPAFFPITFTCYSGRHCSSYVWGPGQETLRRLQGAGGGCAALAQDSPEKISRRCVRTETGPGVTLMRGF